MYICTRQETVVKVVPTNKYGQNYNLIQVDTTFVMDQPFADTEVAFVPSKQLIPPEVLSLVSQQGFDFAPKLGKDVAVQLANLPQEVIAGTDPNKERQESILSLLLTYMDNIKLNTVRIDNTNVYNLRYETKLFPDAQGNYNLKTQIPLAGLQVQNGFSMELLVVLSEGAQVNAQGTRGLAVNGQPIADQVFPITGGANVISFFYQQDPTFDIMWRY